MYIHVPTFIQVDDSYIHVVHAGTTYTLHAGTGTGTGTGTVLVLRTTCWYWYRTCAHTVHVIRLGRRIKEQSTIGTREVVY